MTFLNVLSNESSLSFVCFLIFVPSILEVEARSLCVCVCGGGDSGQVKE